MNREHPAIPEGWERVPREQALAIGDMFWHPWKLKWEDYWEDQFKDHDKRRRWLNASDYYDAGSVVIRKKESTQ